MTKGRRTSQNIVFLASKPVSCSFICALRLQRKKNVFVFYGLSYCAAFIQCCETISYILLPVLQIGKKQISVSFVPIILFVNQQKFSSQTRQMP